MFQRTASLGGRILLSPRKPLLAGGAAEDFEIQLQHLLRSGHTNLLIDLSAVPSIDSAGIRALVRAHTTAQRMGASVRLAAVSPAVKEVLELTHLTKVFESYDSVEGARVAGLPWQRVLVTAGGALLCATLAWVGIRWADTLAAIEGGPAAATSPIPTAGGSTLAAAEPFLQLAKLAAALLIGALVTAVHRPFSRDRVVARSMAHAQMLLCMAGALMMIVIGNSLARAFGVVGAASIVRFRTAVDDPKDVTILFILMGLGMATGLGAFAVAGLGTAFLCVTLLGLERLHRDQQRLMSMEIVSTSREFETARVEEVFTRNQVTFEAREITQSDDITVKYHTWIDPRVSIAELSAQMRAIPGVTEVVWQHSKK